MAGRKSDVEIGTDPKVATPKGAKNETLERETRGLAGLVLYSSLFIALDLWKQITSYGIKYYNNDRYALPQTAVVGITEVLKLFLSFLLLLYNGNLRKVSYTWLFAVPAVIYAINNNVYLFALHYTTPPVWNILIQQRIIFTALVYRFWFKREVTIVQWIALVILVIAIVLTNASEGKSSSGTQNLVFAILLATGGSMLSTLGTVYTEYLMKNNQRSFAEMQLQLYSFGCVGCFVLYVIELSTNTQPENQEWERPNLILFLLVMCILLSGTAGLSTAVIVKKLDNIVKLYTQALSNMLTSGACALLFPNKFNISPLFILCIIMVFVAIFLYERKKVDLPALKRKIISLTSRPTGALVPFVLLGLFLIACTWQWIRWSNSVDYIPKENIINTSMSEKTKI